MEQFITKLKQDLSDRLETLADENNKLAQAYKSSEAVKSTLFKLREYIAEHPFASTASEINYFKKLAPSVYAALFYHLKEYRIEFEKQHGSREKLEALLIHEIEVTDQFFERHEFFYRYYYQQETDLDDRMFIRDVPENMRTDEVEIIMGGDFCVGCYWAARLLANEQLKTYLRDQLELVRTPEIRQTIATLPKLVWTGSLTDMTEMLYALFLAGVFNNGKATMKEIVYWFEQHMNIVLKNYFNTCQEILRRKRSITKFLSQLTGHLVKKAEEDD